MFQRKSSDAGKLCGAGHKLMGHDSPEAEGEGDWEAAFSFKKAEYLTKVEY
jgi:hypothetical protein